MEHHSVNSLQFDPQSTALVLIDLQNGIMGRTLAPHASSDVVAHGATRGRSPRQGRNRGLCPGRYELIFVEDAMSSIKAEVHDFAIQNIFPRLGRVRTVEQVMKALA